MTQVGGVYVDLGLSSANFKKGINDARKQAKGFGKDMDGVFSRISSSFAGAVAGGFLGGVFSGGASGIVASVQNVTRSFADLGREAKTAGIGVEDFQKWRYAADQNRIGIDAMIDAFKELNIRGDEYVKTGKGGGADAFAQIGMSPEEVKTRLKDPSALMLEIIDRTKRLKDTAAGVRIFDELFGGQGGEQFTRLIDQGREGITATLREAEKMGGIVDENFIKRAEDVDKKFNQIATTIGSTLKGAIVDAVTALSGFISQWNAINEKSLSGMKAELDVLKQARDRLSTTQSAGGLQDSVAGLFGQDRETQLKNIAAEEKKITDEMERRKNIIVTTPEQPPVAPYVPPEKPKKTGKSDEEKAREKAAKAADREREAVKALIEDLQFEASLVGRTAVEKEKMIALRQAGAAATDAERKQIEQLVETTYKQSEAWEESQQRLLEINDSAREATGSVIQGMLNGESAANSLANALANVADRLLNDVLDAIFQVNKAGGGGILGGLLSMIGGGSIFGGGGSDPWAGLRLASGGHVRGPGSATSDSIPAMLSNGEFVVNAKATKQNRGILDAINSGMPLGKFAKGGLVPGLAAGGVAGMPKIAPISAPRMPTLPSMSQTNNNTTTSAPVFHISIAANGDETLKSMVIEGVNQGLKQYDKSGPMRFARDSKQANRRGLVR